MPSIFPDGYSSTFMGVISLVQLICQKIQIYFHHREGQIASWHLCYQLLTVPIQGFPLCLLHIFFFYLLRVHSGELLRSSEAELGHSNASPEK
jgi:hypothetical protein